MYWGYNHGVLTQRIGRYNGALMAAQLGYHIIHSTSYDFGVFPKIGYHPERMGGLNMFIGRNEDAAICCGCTRLARCWVRPGAQALAEWFAASWWWIPVRPVLPLQILRKWKAVWGNPQLRNSLWLCQNSYWKWPFIVDLPIKNGDFQ